MKKLFVVLLALMVCFAMPLLAQEDKKEMAAGDTDMTPPTPLTEDEYCSTRVGEWKGWSESPMGKVEQTETVEMALNGQFLLFKSQDTAGWQGMGVMTINPETGEFMGGWADSFRGIYEGTGKRDGNVLTMKWTGYQGTYEAVETMIGDDTISTTWSFTDPAGNTTEGKGELKRVKKMTSK